ncbi:AAA family ATPase [Pelagicoccus albus]|uniref:Cytidylate kinase-like family protein n=1 Tax=Pelagicoccus albus TaxID=415222 RepID=A0A7X1B984_9BACT|nr:cytidylate kinase-like family protein [Pelagicoccus albus]MBC2608024.1 cytidylate kinase-like family protein [Pelagicoccus albus]
MNTIIISRLLGSGAGLIASQLAQSLNYDFVDKEMLQVTMEQYGLTRFGKLYTSPPNIWDLANSKNLQVVSMLDDTMRALAHRKQTVVLARGGYNVLSNRSDVLKVRIQAPFAARVERVMEREGIQDKEQAEKLVAADDKARTKFVARFYHQNWEDASSFDLVINTDLIPTETSVAWISDASRLLEKRDQLIGSGSTESKEVDPLLLEAIEHALEGRV